jgi:hypothetical protein
MVFCPFATIPRGEFPKLRRATWRQRLIPNAGDLPMPAVRIMALILHRNDDVSYLGMIVLVERLAAGADITALTVDATKALLAPYLAWIAFRN